MRGNTPEVGTSNTEGRKRKFARTGSLADLFEEQPDDLEQPTGAGFIFRRKGKFFVSKDLARC